MPADALPNGVIEYVEDDELGIQGLRYQRAIHFSSGDRIYIKPASKSGEKRGIQKSLDDDLESRDEGPEAKKMKPLTTGDQGESAS